MIVDLQTHYVQNGFKAPLLLQLPNGQMIDALLLDYKLLYFSEVGVTILGGVYDQQAYMLNTILVLDNLN